METTVRLAQTNPTTADIEGNTEQILEALSRAEAADVDVLVFPEMAITGYCIRDLIEDETFVDANLAALNRIRDHTGETAVVMGFIERSEGEKYNAAAVLQHGRIQGVARKALLPTYRYFDDERYFEAADAVEPVPVTVGGDSVSLGVSICEDMWDSDYDRQPVSELAAAGADVIININASPFEPGKRQERHGVITDHIDRTGLPFVYLNTVGAADVEKNVIVFDGDSLAYAGDGTLLGTCDAFAEDTTTVTVGHNKADPKAAVADGERSGIQPRRRERELYEALLLGIRDYARKTGFERVIEPISGGIDSSVGLALCADALGPENVLAFNLPSTVNSDTTKSIAAEVAENTGVEYHSIPVQSIYEAVVETYETHYDDVTTDVAKENVYARVRAVLMMLVSNDAPYDDPAMLVSNGNETEMALGYVTLYGDMASGLSLLGDVSKMDVYALGRYINERHGEEIIPEAAFEIEPSAELTAGQVDPFDYQTVSPIVDDLLEQRLSPAEIVARFQTDELSVERYGVDDDGRTVYERYDAEAFEDIVYDTYDRLTRSTFKRVQAAPNIAVSRRAFGTDFREPIINGWDGRPITWE